MFCIIVIVLPVKLWYQCHPPRFPLEWQEPRVHSMLPGAAVLQLMFSIWWVTRFSGCSGNLQVEAPIAVSLAFAHCSPSCCSLYSFMLLEPVGWDTPHL
jgi:hypothetical protein